jgi:hypothetical protein
MSIEMRKKKKYVFFFFYGFFLPFFIFSCRCEAAGKNEKREKKVAQSLLFLNKKDRDKQHLLIKDQRKEKEHLQ